MTNCSGDAQILSARWSGWWNFVLWHPLFVCLQSRTCFMSPFWHLQCSNSP